MEANPYQAPTTDGLTLPISQRAWFRFALGTCCFCIAPIFVAIGFITASTGHYPIVALLFLGTFTTAWCLMGIGLFVRRDRLVLTGWLLFFVPLGAIVAVRIAQIIDS